MPAKVDFVFFDAGGGHRSAATALKTVIERQARPWEVRLVNLQEVLDPLDIFRKLTGLRLQDIYNLLLKKGWTLGTPQLLKAMHAVIRLYHPAQLRLLAQFWRPRQPDLVVSLVPQFNRAICESLQTASPGTPFVTILTDLADYPPHFWIERQQQYLVCGTARAQQQALSMGHPPERVFRSSGMILRPAFYEVPRLDQEAERQRRGLRPGVPTGLVLFGGHGSNAMLGIARRLDRTKRDVQLILICGRNEKLARKLRAIESRIPMLVEGFTSEIPYYMSLADFFIGKPGPGSVSEALAMGLPVIVERNAWTMPQERYNADWIRECETGLVLASFRHIARAVERLLDPGVLERCRANAAAMENRAVFEIPEFLDRVMSSHKGFSGQECLG